MTESISNQTNISLEKVIGGLECCATDRKRREDCEAISCPYLDLEGHGCIHQLIRDALALLKAQEPKPVHVTAIISNRKIGECPNCGKPINSGDYPRYCGDCGQAVKWE